MTGLDSILADAIGGKRLDPLPEAAKALPEQPYRVLQTTTAQWAVFLPLGGRFSKGTLKAMGRARSVGFEPVVVVTDQEGLRATAAHFVDLRPFIACDIAGRSTLIPPPGREVRRRRMPPPRYHTRIPRGLLRELRGEACVPRYILRAIGVLLREYAPLAKRRGDNDHEEYDLLMAFANQALRQIGFCNATAEATKLLRSIELGGWGGNRDHFFHSFHSFFLGLIPVAQLFNAFIECQSVSKLNWSVDPFAVWLLVALYHDVGYSTENLEDILCATVGFDEADTEASDLRARFLSADAPKEALRQISSLIVRLLGYSKARSTWSPPTSRTKRAVAEVQVEQALVGNYSDGHGASGALRLYGHLIPMIERMRDVAKRDLLRQTVLLAAASIPFHDWHFRRCLREQMGMFSVPTGVMPYACTLAFIDSIQDDRRDLGHLSPRPRFLEHLVTSRPCKVSAKLSMAALDSGAVLWKIVEGRDVLAHLGQNAETLNFQYPGWMVG